jgi:hypothetical protein
MIETIGAILWLGYWATMPFAVKKKVDNHLNPILYPEQYEEEDEDEDEEEEYEEEEDDEDFDDDEDFNDDEDFDDDD